MSLSNILKYTEEVLSCFGQHSGNIMTTRFSLLTLKYYRYHTITYVVSIGSTVLRRLSHSVKHLRLGKI